MLPKLAGLPRSQLRKLEEGGNVTLLTVQKILEQLSGTELTLGPQPVDESALREALSTGDGEAARARSIGRSAGPHSGRIRRATRYQGSSESDLEAGRRVQTAIEATAAARKRGPKKREH